MALEDGLAQVLVRNIEQDVVERLRSRARRSGLSLEEVARQALREFARPSRAAVLEEIDRLRALSSPSDHDSTDEIRRWRDLGRDGD